SLYFLPKAAPIIDETARVIGATVVLTDVTDLRRLDEMKSGLLSLVSHELKTPLTSMRMILHLIVEERIAPLAPKQRELLIAARDDSDRLHQIVENLLDMGRIESGRVLMETRTINASELVRESIAPLMPAFVEHGISVEADLPEDAPRVVADP